MQHGLLSSADTWIANRAEKAPAFRLATEGYDVWLGNNRGNLHSRAHETLDAEKDSKQYFDYDFEDNGKYDLPAQLDFVRNVTGDDKKLIYVGHSQGTSQMFYELVKDEEKMSRKIDLFVALAPVIRLKHIDNKILEDLAYERTMIDGLANTFGVYEVFGPEFKSKLCEKFPKSFCQFFDFLVSNRKDINDPERSLAAKSKFPQPGSWK